MRKREILTDPNPILREETQIIESFDGELQELIDDMIYTMREADGIGLAAPQIGENKKIIVVEYETEGDKDNTFPLTVIVNPEISKCSDEENFMAEGCLSFPGKEMYIKRPKNIIVKGFDRWGKETEINAGKLFARALQHEIDHINGVLMIDHIKPVDTIFIGNGDLGIPALIMMTENPQFKLKSVITSSDQPSGRKKEMTPTPIAQKATKLGINTLKVDTIKDSKIINKIKTLSPELIVLADFREIIPSDIINIPKYGVLNIHPSLLPRYRGPSPVSSAILDGEKKTGVTIIKIDENVDTGDILAFVETKIKKRENVSNLKKRLSEIGADLLAELVPYYLAGEISPIKQKEEKANETTKFNKESGKLSGKEKPEKIDRMVRALTPWPGVYIIKNGKRIYITRAHLGKNGDLIIEKVKPEGKREMDYRDYLRGNKEKLTFG